MVSKMSHQPVAGTLWKAKKADRYLDEDRDTINAKTITEFLMVFLFALGQDVQASQIKKNTGEEAQWYDCRLSWRWSALWLFVRVTLQLTFEKSVQMGTERLYKSVLFLMTHILDLPSTSMPYEHLQLIS